MPPRKRTAAEASGDEAETGRTTRGSKAAKTDGGSKPNSKAKPAPKAKAKGGAKKGPKAPAATSFLAGALPLHFNITHTPPSIPDEDTKNASSADPGNIGHLAIIPTEFKTGSYGWKGTKRIVIELKDPNSSSSSGEKLQVQLQINATVMGSKGAKDAPEAEGEDAAEAEVEAEEDE